MNKTFLTRVFQNRSNDEDECSQAMKCFFKETIESGASYYEYMNLWLIYTILNKNTVFKKLYIILCQNYGSEKCFQGL